MKYEEFIKRVDEAAYDYGMCYDPTTGELSEAGFRDVGYNHGHLFAEFSRVMEGVLETFKNQADAVRELSERLEAAQQELKAYKADKPDPALIESMALRYDHAHGIPMSFPVEETEEEWRRRQEYNRGVAYQMWEEVVGRGFYKHKQLEKSGQ